MIRSFNSVKSPLTLTFAFAATLMLSCSDDDNKVPITVNEDVFINEVYSAGDDWLELYNSGSVEKNIGGYFIYDDDEKKYSIPANTTIPAKGFLVLFCDDTNTGLHTNFKLSSDGEVVSLENTAGNLIDRVEFPALNEAQAYGRFPDGSDKLVISGAPTKGTSNGETQAPAITKTERIPLIPLTSEAVIVKSTLVSSDGVISVKLFYRVNGASFESMNMSLSGGAYSATIPAANTTGSVEYYIEVKSSSNKTTVDPTGAPTTSYNYLLNTDVLPPLVINEFMASNTACCPDTDGSENEYDDWIEIYNPGPTSINLANMYISDNKANPFKYRIPATDAAKTTVPSGGYLLLWADGAKSQGLRHLDLSLAKDGEDVGIYYIDGRTIDVYSFGAQADNVSFGRSPNGGTTWKSYASPSPGAANQ